MAALFCAAKLSLSGSASFKLEMLFPFTPCVSARVNTSVPCMCGICPRSSVSPVSSSVTPSLFPSAASSHTHVSLSEISACVRPPHLAASGSGGRSRCVCLWVGRPHPSFLFSYHCSTAALSGKQPFHRPLLRGAPVGAGTALPDPPCGNDRPRLSVILGTLLACADRAVLALFCLGPAHNGLLQTAAILFVPVPLVCPPLLHSDRHQIIGPSFKRLGLCCCFWPLQIPL